MTSSLAHIKESTSAAFFPWQPACWLRVSGPDAAPFLQGQFTNELRGAAPGAAVYGLWLSLKGKVVADSFVLRGTATDEFWIGSYFSPAAVIRARLESHIIADDVTLEDHADAWAALSVWGVSAEMLGALPGAFVFSGRRSREPNLEIVFPRSMESVVRTRLDAMTQIDRATIERRRIEAGIPAVPVDAGPNDLPNEAGLEPAAISYTKGCYLGQEVMARLKSMGQVRRRLLPVRGMTNAAPIPPLPAPLFVEARQVGEWRSAAHAETGGVIGLAMLSLLHVAAGAELALAPGGAPVLRVADTP